jgi:hypothetical protein
MRRTLLVIACLSLVGVVLTGLPQNAAAFPEPYCPLDHFRCPDELYDCCCAKGVRCDLTPEQCAQWCEGSLPGGGGLGSP